MEQSESYSNNRTLSSVIFVNIPVEESVQSTVDQRWYFQRLFNWVQKTETKIYGCITNNRLYLSIFYFTLIAICITRILLHLWILHKNSKDISNNNRRIILIEVFLSLIWLLYYAIQYTRKYKHTYVENIRRVSIIYGIFCVQYFTVSFWVINVIRKYSLTWEYVLGISLFILYAFLAEKSPNLFIIVVYTFLLADL